MLWVRRLALSRRSDSSLTCFASFLMVLILDPRILGQDHVSELGETDRCLGH